MIETTLNCEHIPIACGNESHAFSFFRNWCVDTFETPQLVCLRNDKHYTVSDREKAIKHRQEYFENEPRFYDERFQDYSWVSYKTVGNKKNFFRARCEKFLHEHIGELAEHFCRAKYGSVKTAFIKTTHWIDLWNEFEEWYEGRRKKFMAKMQNEIAKNNKGEVIPTKKPNSHGGVANLLKVLTKTMEQQGADIRSIAKMQYAVCTQAGVRLPDEFLTDVAVALDVLDSEVENDSK